MEKSQVSIVFLFQNEMNKTHDEMRSVAKDVLDNYVLRDDRRLVSREDKDAFYEVVSCVLAECVISLLDPMPPPRKSVNWDDYHGGGSILNGYTTVRNVASECESHNLSDYVAKEVWRIVSSGGEVIILNGEIKAVRNKTK